MLNFEDQYYSEEVELIVGVDEAGRGPLCGPVVAETTITIIVVAAAIRV